MSSEHGAICPRCGKVTGRVATPCSEPSCARDGYRLVPLSWYQSTRDYLARRLRPMDPLVGRVLEGKYLLAGLLGEGGMGVVYVALHLPLLREVAVKLIAGIEITEEALTRFEREALAISRLDHPNIVKLFDYGVGDLGFPVPYMVLEYVRHGRTLRAAWQDMRDPNTGDVSCAVVLAIFRQILDALSEAHAKGIVHRDIKPENVMITRVGKNPYMVKVLDFGLAKAFQEVSSSDRGLSTSGRVGTPYYMAPEQAPLRGPPQALPQSDLYAVGVMLFEIFTGIRPFDGESELQVLLKKVDPNYRPLELPEAKFLPQGFRDFLEKALAIDPSARFSSADEMLQALESVLAEGALVPRGPVGHKQVSDRPATPKSQETRGYESAVSRGTAATTLDAKPVEEEPVRKEKRHHWFFIFAALFALVALSGIFFWQQGLNPEPAQVVVSRDIVQDPGPAISIIPSKPDITQAPVLPQPEPGPLKRVFLISTSPPATIEVDGVKLGKGFAKYEFLAQGEDWRNKEVVIRAFGPGLVGAMQRITLGHALESGIVEITLERERKAARRSLGKGLEGILGPNEGEPERPQGAGEEKRPLKIEDLEDL